MLIELVVADLGVIADASLLLGPGMTALTGETGAGKTLVVEAIDLLVGGRAEAHLVRPGRPEARVSGRFVHGDEELVLSRVVPSDGRSRAYVDGRPATAGELAERAAALVDLHGQHAHQSLLAPRVQRDALDRFGRVDLAPLVQAKARLRSLDEAVAALGGDARARAREMDLLRFQVGELDDAAIAGPDEDDALERLEDELAGAAAHREAAASAIEALAGEGGAADVLGLAIAALAPRRPFEVVEARTRALAAELADVTGEIRTIAERIEEDPERMESVRSRRRLLRELIRKYGETLDDVLAYVDEARARLAEIESHDLRAATLDAERTEAQAAVEREAAAVGAARRRAAPELGVAIEAHLRELAMPKARFEVDVTGHAGDVVTFLIGANPGEPALPLAKVASGGELARTMLAARLVLAGPGGPTTLVFDEVDAGIGGAAAVAVGRALAAVAADRQVLVVTHLPQVAAFADHHVAVTKEDEGGRTIARLQPLDESARVVELSRMLSGQPDSATARGHAEELLDSAARDRGR